MAESNSEKKIPGSWDEAVAAAGLVLKDGKLKPEARQARVEELLLRTVTEEQLKPGYHQLLKHAFADQPLTADVTLPDFFGHFISLRGVQGPGFCAFWTDDGTLSIYRVLKYKSADEGGNDYVLIDRLAPGVQV